MLVFHVWFNAPMPEIYKQYIATLDRFVPQHNVKHVIYSEKPEYIEGLQELCPHLEIRDFKPYLNFAQQMIRFGQLEKLRFQYCALADISRYKIIRELVQTEDYVYCLDTDICFMRDPFVDVLIPRDKAVFFHELTEVWGELSACNGIMGIPHNSILSKEMMDWSFKFLNEFTARHMGDVTFGPFLISSILRSKPQDDPSYILEKDTTIFFSANCFAFYDCFDYKEPKERAEKIQHVIDIIRSSPKAIAFHLYKNRPYDVDEVNKIGALIMEGVTPKL